MEWTDYIRDVGKRQISVEQLPGKMVLSDAEIDALLAVFPTKNNQLSFVCAGQKIMKNKKTITSQINNIYRKFEIEPKTPEELAARLRNGFDRLNNQVAREKLRAELISMQSQLGIDALWSKLKELGKYAPERMGIYIAENDIEKASAFPKDYQPKPFLDLVPQGTQRLKFKIVSERMGQVLLLNRDEASVVYCLCPSEFAPSIDLHRGENLVPQPDESIDHAYLGAEMVGREEWWAWIVDKMPPLSWLNAAQNQALQLNAQQLAELLSKVELQQGEVLHTFYRVH